MVGAGRDADVIIVGGGIGGLSAALMIGRTGLHVRVLERASEFTEIGAGLQLAPNATRVLRQYGLLDDVLARAVLPRRLVGRSALTGQELTFVDLEDAAERYGAPYLVTHRRDLHDVLVNACRAEATVALETNKAVCTVAETGAGVEVTTEDGSAYRADVLVGADGVHSRVRRLVIDDEPICSGYVAYRGVVPSSFVEGGAAADDVVIWIGPGLHFVQYPLRAGELYNQVAVFRSEEYLLGKEDWGSPAELEDAFSVTCDQVRAALPSISRDRRWPMVDRLPAPQWSAGRVTLLGDAAHPMLQYLAQGACQAIQDGAALARALHPAATAGRLANEAERAFGDYEAARLAQASRVQTTARIWGDMWHLDGVAMVVRDEAFRLRAPNDYRRIDWLWGDQIS